MEIQSALDLSKNIAESSWYWETFAAIELIGLLIA
ncbi:hypothetical protein SLEP1_g18736 [Rubroshorea leprosula]|uniref:Uncharacterized protein n=1 Tax=Rubroshorea leprosula TaxID=152421 RepID=A0AAV5J441_9ROSI|nr:hypothetical protein SLEP1_g18736 [Rubroshorea leprosula]